MSKAKEISALYKDIKQQMGRLVSLCHDVESHYEVTADAYQRGYETGYKDGYNEPGKNQQEAYQQGLNDAWDAARKIGCESMYGLEKIGFDFSQCVFNDYNPSWFVVKNYSVSECIEKIRQYEQEKDKRARIEYNFYEIKDVIETTAKEYNMSLDEISAVLQKMKESDNG